MYSYNLHEHTHLFHFFNIIQACSHGIENEKNAGILTVFVGMFREGWPCANN
jgi:hypothetical protein